MHSWFFTCGNCRKAYQLNFNFQSNRRLSVLTETYKYHPWFERIASLSARNILLYFGNRETQMFRFQTFIKNSGKNRSVDLLHVSNFNQLSSSSKQTYILLCGIQRRNLKKKSQLLQVNLQTNYHVWISKIAIAIFNFIGVFWNFRLPL